MRWDTPKWSTLQVLGLKCLPAVPETQNQKCETDKPIFTLRQLEVSKQHKWQSKKDMIKTEILIT